MASKVKKVLLHLKEYIKSKWQQYFIARDEVTPGVTRQKQIRLGIVILVIFVLVCSFIVGLSEDKNKLFATNPEKQKVQEISVDISNLAKGTENEKLWVSGAQTDLEALRRKQENTESEQKNFKEYVDQTKMSKDEVMKLIAEARQEVELEASKKLEAILEEVRKGEAKATGEERALAHDVMAQKKVKKFGEYIPAGSYVEAKLISGADAGVGVSAEANPRQVEMRVTGEVISAGYGKNYLRSPKLIGCLVQGTVSGEISSEKAYIRLVVMTCATNNNTVIEIPVKGYVTTLGKVGIRGEVVSREGDLVLKSFLSGAIGGFGSGISEYSKPSAVISGGNLFSAKGSIKDIATSSFGQGMGTSSDKLSDYFIKRAEQYQPVISIDGGIDVNVVFQEGFSLRDSDAENKK